MKRIVQALVLTGALVLAAAAHAVSPVATIRGDVALSSLSTDGGGAPAGFDVHVAFSTDPPGAPPFTIQKAVIFFPDRAGTNGTLFRSCSARQIERFHGAIRRCPKGSQIGRGTLRAQALQLGVTATGRVTLFNGAHGRSVTFNIRTTNPADINESIDAPLQKLRGSRYGEKLTLVVPHSLQEILTGVYVGLEDFDVTIDGAVTVDGVTHSYLRARACPRRPLHAVFDLEDWTTGEAATATADTTVRCRDR